jgi:hypothetical protein
MRLALAIALCLPLIGTAQAPNALLDTTVLRIGEQTTLRLVLDYRADQRPASLEWPAIGDTLSSSIEVLQSGAIDSVAPAPDADPTAMQLVKQLTITSFDSGFHAIPPFRFVINGNSVETRALLLEVRTVELDSADALRPLRDIIEPPFSLLFWAQERWMWIAGGVALVALAVLLWIWYRKRPQRVLPEAVEAPGIPLHDRILGELRQLEGERIWQQGLHKAYHSRLTDLLRGYIEERYRVPAMESTTDELVHALRVSPLSREQQERLENMLRLADMVKFAKATPTPIENEQMMSAALRFVEETADRSSPVGPTTKATSHAR